MAPKLEAQRSILAQIDPDQLPTKIGQNDLFFLTKFDQFRSNLANFTARRAEKLITWPQVRSTIRAVTILAKPKSTDRATRAALGGGPARLDLLAAQA